MQPDVKTIPYPHPVDAEANQEYEGGMPTEKNWVDFAINRYHDCDEMFGYVDATVDITKHVQSLLENSNHQSIEEFRRELSTFCDQRSTFIQHFKKIPSPGDLWG